MQWEGEEVGRRNGSLCLRVEIVNEFAHCTEGGAFFISCLQSKAEGMGSVLDYLREGNFLSFNQLTALIIWSHPVLYMTNKTVLGPRFGWGVGGHRYIPREV